MKQWFRRSHPPVVSNPLQETGQWPLALRLDETDLGTALTVRPVMFRMDDAPSVAEVYLTAEGLRRPILVLGADPASTTQTLLRLAGRALEESARTVVVVQGDATTAQPAPLTALMSRMGRTPALWGADGRCAVDWVSASTTAMHRRVRELLRESPLMANDGDTVDLILHSMLNLSLDPLRSVDDLIARCRTLYAYAAQMQSDAAQTAARVMSLTALTPPAATGNDPDDEVVAASWDAQATRRRMLDWAVKTDVHLIAEVRDLCAVRLRDLSPILTEAGWSLATADAVVVTLPDRATVERRAQRRFVLDAILHDLLLRMDAQRPITLILDSVDELCCHGLPSSDGRGGQNSQTLRDRLLALPALAGRGLQVVLSAPASADLDPALHERLLAADPLAIIHATWIAEPVLEVLSGQAVRTWSTIHPDPRGMGVMQSCRVERTRAVPACRSRGLAPDEAYLVTGQHAALIQMIPFDALAGETAQPRTAVVAWEHKEIA